MKIDLNYHISGRSPMPSKEFQGNNKKKLEPAQLGIESFLDVKQMAKMDDKYIINKLKADKHIRKYFTPLKSIK